LTHRDSPRVRILEPIRAAQVQRQSDIVVPEEEWDRISRELSIGTKDENLRHSSICVINKNAS
jgi:hypothetical protein